MAATFQPATGDVVDFTQNAQQLELQIRVFTRALKEMMIDNNGPFTQGIMQTEDLPEHCRRMDPRLLTSLTFLQLCNELDRRFGKQTQIRLYSRPVHLGAAAVTYPPVLRPEDFVFQPLQLPDNSFRGFRIEGTLCLDGSLYPGVRVTGGQSSPGLVLEDAIKRLLPAKDAVLALQDCSWTQEDEGGGQFTVWAKNEWTNNQWTPLSFWYVFRRDRVGGGEDADGRADMGWQIVQAARSQ